MHYQGTNNHTLNVEQPLPLPSTPSFQNFSGQISFPRCSGNFSNGGRLIYITPSSSLSPTLIGTQLDDGQDKANNDTSQSIIVIERPHVGRPEPTNVRPWSTSIFGCLTDLTSCFQTCICPCKTMGQVHEIVSEGKTSRWEGAIGYFISHLMCCTCVFYLWNTRTRMRNEYKLEGNACTDCMVSLCCLHSCALCQEYRELNHQGFDPSLGWHENVERQKHAVAVYRITPPSVEENMTR